MSSSRGGARIAGVVGLIGLALAGCGGSGVSSAAGGGGFANTNLNGNWLLVGTLPFTGLSGTPLNTAFGIDGTFNVVGTNVEAALTDNVACGSLAESGPAAVVTGSIAADGSFSMQTAGSSPPPATVSLRGSVPINGAASWSGNLTFASNSTTCPAAQTVSFTAVRIAAVTGTYVGAAPLTFTGGSNPAGTQNATFSFALQQGATLPGSSVFEANALSGTVSVQGVSCFSSGTIAVPGSGVLGSEFEVQMTMNDGSTADVLGQILDTGSVHLSLTAVSGSGSACGTFFSSPFTVTR